MATEHGLLCLTCVKCGITFPSAMQMDPWTLEAIRLGQMRERCTSCGHVGLYRKADYHFASPDPALSEAGAEIQPFGR